ncbi:uncharacterized protein METZ01_LOCUS439679 [marine metagenome]|uniref:Uncharacterized protein n=1 Tax=marine metagenome TaxID=408172 RepID=A0A382YVF5_9ZZZZ
MPSGAGSGDNPKLALHYFAPTAFRDTYVGIHADPWHASLSIALQKVSRIRLRELSKIVSKQSTLRA